MPDFPAFNPSGVTVKFHEFHAVHQPVDAQMALDYNISIIANFTVCGTNSTETWWMNKTICNYDHNYAKVDIGFPINADPYVDFIIQSPNAILSVQFDQIFGSINAKLRAVIKFIEYNSAIPEADLDAYMHQLEQSPYGYGCIKGAMDWNCSKSGANTYTEWYAKNDPTDSFYVVWAHGKP